MARVSERLWQRLHAMGLADRCGVGLRSLRASRSDRANGAWSWTAVDEAGIPLSLGSQIPMAELLAAKRLRACLDSYSSVDTGAGDIVIDMDRGHAATGVPVGVWVPTRLGQILLEEI